MKFPWTAPTLKSKLPKGTQTPVVAEEATTGAPVDPEAFRCIPSKISTMADGTLRVQMDFQEMPLGDVARVFSFLKHIVIVTLKHDEVNND